jgi:hypothetical protein
VVQPRLLRLLPGRADLQDAAHAVRLRRRRLLPAHRGPLGPGLQDLHLGGLPLQPGGPGPVGDLGRPARPAGAGVRLRQLPRVTGRV